MNRWTKGAFMAMGLAVVWCGCAEPARRTCVKWEVKKLEAKGRGGGSAKGRDVPRLKQGWEPFAAYPIGVSGSGVFARKCQEWTSLH